MKSKEELNALKEEVETVNEKLAELTPEEIAQVNGGGTGDRPIPEQKRRPQPHVTTAGAERSGHGQVSVHPAL